MVVSVSVRGLMVASLCGALARFDKRLEALARSQMRPYSSLLRAPKATLRMPWSLMRYPAGQRIVLHDFYVHSVRAADAGAPTAAGTEGCCHWRCPEARERAAHHQPAAAGGSETEAFAEPALGAPEIHDRERDLVERRGDGRHEVIRAGPGVFRQG